MQHLFVDCVCKNFVTNQPNRQACQQFIDSVSNPYAANSVEIYDSRVRYGNKEVLLQNSITFWQLYQNIETIIST